MKISICIPQYNRINFLLKSLELLARQTYESIEVVISDDCSTDETQRLISELIPAYKYPILYSRNIQNEGYDRNYRKCIELATGDYAFVIGNDDAVNGENSIDELVDFLQKNNFPDIGFCNMVEEGAETTLIKRATISRVIGAGPDVSMKHYSCFSFVGGLIYKTSSFRKYNTDKYDGSIYAQMYLGVLMIASGCRLFSIHQPMVLKDIIVGHVKRNSYRDTIARKWNDFKIVDGGLPSVINVLINGLIDSNALSQNKVNYIFRRMYSITFPHWILDYKQNNALPEAVGLIIGMQPQRNHNFRRLSLTNKLQIFTIYGCSSVLALLTPAIVFKGLKGYLYRFFKK